MQALTKSGMLDGQHGKAEDTATKLNRDPEEGIASVTYLG